MAATTALGMAAMKAASSVAQLVSVSVVQMAAPKDESLDRPTVASWAGHLAVLLGASSADWTAVSSAGR